VAKLRRTIISRVYSELESSDFSLRDFKVDFEETNHFVHIQFLPFTEYEFEIVERDVTKINIGDALNPRDADYRLFTDESPGEYKIRASLRHDSIDQCLDRISVWCESVEEELAAPMPEPMILEDFEEELEHKLNEKAGDSKERFSEEEISILKEKLDALTQRFVELEKANEITEKELNAVKSKVETMKDNLSVYPKSTWYKVSGHKILDVLKKITNSKEGKDLLLSSAKKLLGLD